MIINIDYEIDFNNHMDLSELFSSIAKKGAGVLSLPSVFNDVEVNVIITDNESIKEINKETRDIDSPTDVLSFPMFYFDLPGEIKDFSGETILGDIIISLERAKEQSEEYGHSLKRELCFLFTHGMLHILGYDHIEDSDRLIMEDLQDKILNELDIRR